MNLINHGSVCKLKFFDVNLMYFYILQKCEDCPCLLFLTAQWTVFNVAIRWTDKLITTLLELYLTANWLGIWDRCVPSHIKRKYFSRKSHWWIEGAVFLLRTERREAPKRWSVAAALGSTGSTGVTIYSV